MRLIAATNTDLLKAVAAGAFREDLYYRLRVISIRLPPLGERKGDVALLGAHFLQVYARENGKAIASIAPAALALLEAHAWPGNVRELENVIQKAIVLCRGDAIGADLVADDLQAGKGAPRPRAAAGAQKFKDVVDEFERDLIVDALREARGVQKKAAEQLGLKPTTLNEKIKRLRIRYRD